MPMEVGTNKKASFLKRRSVGVLGPEEDVGAE